MGGFEFRLGAGVVPVVQFWLALRVCPFVIWRLKATVADRNGRPILKKDIVAISLGDPDVLVATVTDNISDLRPVLA